MIYEFGRRVRRWQHLMLLIDQPCEPWFACETGPMRGPQRQTLLFLCLNSVSHLQHRYVNLRHGE
jgi:hypothetical protein